MLTSSGSNFRVGPVNFTVHSEQDSGRIATAAALTFMGARADLGRKIVCGHGASSRRSATSPTGEWKEENVFWDPLNSSAVAGNTGA